MKIRHALQEYLLDIEVRKYTPQTIRSYQNNLNLFVRYLDEEAEQRANELATTFESLLYVLKQVWSNC